MTINDEEFQIRWDTGSPAVKKGALRGPGEPRWWPARSEFRWIGREWGLEHSPVRNQARVWMPSYHCYSQGGLRRGRNHVPGASREGRGGTRPGESQRSRFGQTGGTQARRQLDEQIAQNKTLLAELDRLREQHANDAAPKTVL